MFYTVMVVDVVRLNQLPPDDRLDPARVIRDLQSHGTAAAYLPDADVIVVYVRQGARNGIST